MFLMCRVYTTHNLKENGVVRQEDGTLRRCEARKKLIQVLQIWNDPTFNLFLIRMKPGSEPKTRTSKTKVA
jgi:hypothetical protein